MQEAVSEVKDSMTQSQHTIQEPRSAVVDSSELFATQRSPSTMDAAAEEEITRFDWEAYAKNSRTILFPPLYYCHYCYYCYYCYYCFQRELLAVALDPGCCVHGSASCGLVGSREA